MRRGNLLNRNIVGEIKKRSGFEEFLADAYGCTKARAKLNAQMKTAAVDRYKSIGFMCGLEIHQRLATEEKLFCSCSTNILDKSAKPNATVTRYQRAVAGELGSIDKSAEFEEGKNRSFTYNVFDGNTCLVDIDEEPPHPLNMEALEHCTVNRISDEDEDHRRATAHEEERS